MERAMLGPACVGWRSGVGCDGRIRRAGESGVLLGEKTMGVSR